MLLSSNKIGLFLNIRENKLRKYNKSGQKGCYKSLVNKSSILRNKARFREQISKVVSRGYEQPTIGSLILIYCSVTTRAEKETFHPIINYNQKLLITWPGRKTTRFARNFCWQTKKSIF